MSRVLRTPVGLLGDRLDRPPATLAIVGAGLAVAVYAAATSAYLAAVAPVITDLRVLAYPAVWLAVSVGTAVWVDRTVAGRRRPWLGRVVGGAYVLGLCWLGGLLGASAGAEPLRVLSTLPGWGPIVIYDTEVVRASLVPFKLVAYLALGHVVAVLVAAQGRSVRAAALGVATCVSCTAPLLVAIGGLLGGVHVSAMLASVGYDVATVVLVATFGLLARAASRTAAAEDDRSPDGLTESPAGGGS